MINTKEELQDKIEITKQQAQIIQLKLDSTIIPNKNHILFEINLLTQEIKKAVFFYDKVIAWNDAINGNVRNNKKVNKKNNCIYISCLNEENSFKILKKDYGINLNKKLC